MAEQPRRSRRLQGKQPERDAIDSLCVICLLSISIKLFNCMITKCCNRPIHRPCWNEALKYKSRCPRCRTRQGVQYPDNVNPRRLPGNWERVGYAREISTSKNNFLFCFIFSITIIVVNETLNTTFSFLSLQHFLERTWKITWKTLHIFNRGLHWRTTNNCI